MNKGIVVLIIVLILIGIGAWYYLTRVHVSEIESLLSNPKAYEGKVVTIEGEVTDRTLFLVRLNSIKLETRPEK